MDDDLKREGRKVDYLMAAPIRRPARPPRAWHTRDIPQKS
jgi:hypothetical protein